MAEPSPLQAGAKADEYHSMRQLVLQISANR